MKGGEAMLGNIINSIWELPWYKVLLVAILDDVILLIKLWPLWVVLFVGALAIGVFGLRSNH